MEQNNRISTTLQKCLSLLVIILLKRDNIYSFQQLYNSDICLNAGNIHTLSKLNEINPLKACAGGSKRLKKKSQKPTSTSFVVLLK